MLDYDIIRVSAGIDLVDKNDLKPLQAMASNQTTGEQLIVCTAVVEDHQDKEFVTRMCLEVDGTRVEWLFRKRYRDSRERLTDNPALDTSRLCPRYR